MAKRKRSSSSDITPPAIVYSTRSSARKSLNLDTDATRDHLSRESSTPTTESTNQSTDFQNSPSSSRTSSNIIEAIPKQISPSTTARPLTGKATRSIEAEGARATSEGSKGLTNEPIDRPGRRRKPTQKAAELAANTSSKLFKSIGTTQIKNDDAEDVEESLPLESEHLLTDDDACGAVQVSGDATPRADGLAVVMKISSNEPTVKEEEPPAEQTINSDEYGVPSTSPQKRKQKRKSQRPGEVPVDVRKSINTRSTRSSSKTPAVEIHIIPPDSPSLMTYTDTGVQPATSSGRAATDGQQKPPSPAKPGETSPTSKESVPTRKTAPSRPHNTIDSPKPITAITTTTQQFHVQKPTRIKFKPLKPTITSALDGYTNLPCNLSCLENTDLFYMWAKISIEHQDLADNICRLEGGCDGDTGEKARILRGKLNGVMAEFCLCGESTRKE